jgi:hypothetical protein
MAPSSSKLLERPRRSGSLQEPETEQVKVFTTVPAALEELQLVDLALGLTIAPL